MSSNQKQVFQTENPNRWKGFRLIIGSAFLLLILLFGLGIYSISTFESLDLPKQVGENIYLKLTGADTISNETHSEFNKDISVIRNQKRPDFYNHKGSEFLFSNNKLKPLLPIRAGFFVNWDIQSYLSLKQNINHMNMVLPEWFFVCDTSDEVSVDFSDAALKALKVLNQSNVYIIPMISNFYNQKWNGKNVHRIIHSKEKSEKFIKSVLYNLEKYKFHGVNIDFEELDENTDEYIIAFQKKLYQALHAKGYFVSQDVSPFNEDYNYNELIKYNDYIFLMAYDQHNQNSLPGAVSAHDWIENALDEALNKIPSEKVILCVAGYGYDWAKGCQGVNITYQEAISTAAESDTFPFFNNSTYNLNYTYWDENNIEHQVYFTDAATAYNVIRTSEDFGTAGVALWRLGSEDERMWSFFNKNLSVNMISKKYPLSKSMLNVEPSANIDYIGAGEILNMLTSPSKGLISFEYDSIDHLITEEKYKVLPTGYVIKKSGEKKGKIVLTFDDGPDENYTPRIVAILKKYDIPASFFVTGINIQNNLPALRMLVKEGYEIGNHTYSHVNLETASKERILLELRTTRRMIEAITGKSTIMFRPPYNTDAEPQKFSELFPLSIGKDDNYICIGSSIDPRDWEIGLPADSIVARAIAQQKLGNIILLHDAGGVREEMLKALPRIIEYYKNNGYVFTTIADLMDRPKEELMPLVKGKSNIYFGQLNEVLLSVTYYAQRGLFILFLFALIVTAFRAIIIAILATKKKLELKTKKINNQPNNDLVSIIVPAYNEEINVVKTINHLLKSTYNNFEIVVIDDGSTDNTFNNLKLHFLSNNKVKLYSKINGGKASAINYGISVCNGSLLFCVDADTNIDSKAIEYMVTYFDNQNLAALAGNVKVGNTVNLITNWQSIEYVISQNFERMAFDVINAIMVVPGAIGMFRKIHIEKVGLFTLDTLAEDCDLTMRLLDAGYEVKTCNEALAFTEAPETISGFMKQRKRWCFGIMQSFWKHKKTLFSFKKPNLGWILLPNIILFQLVLPFFNPLVDLMLLFSLLFGKTFITFMLYLIYFIIEILIATIAFAYQGNLISIKTILYLIPQRIIYRQLLFIVLIKSYLKAIKGEFVHWGVLKRTGNVITK